MQTRGVYQPNLVKLGLCLGLTLLLSLKCERSETSDVWLLSARYDALPLGPDGTIYNHTVSITSEDSVIIDSVSTEVGSIWVTQVTTLEKDTALYYIIGFEAVDMKDGLPEIPGAPTEQNSAWKPGMSLRLHYRVKGRSESKEFLPTN